MQLSAQFAQRSSQLLRFAFQSRLITPGFALICVQPCPAFCQNVDFVCERVGIHVHILPGIQQMITQKIVLSGIPLQLFQLFQQLATYHTRCFAPAHLTEQVQIPKIHSPEAFQLFSQFGCSCMRTNLILFPLAHLLPMLFDPLQIVHNATALRCNPHRELSRRIVLTQRFQSNEPLAVWMPDYYIFSLFVETDFISACAQQTPKFVQRACL